MPCSCTLTWKYADEPTQQRASYFYLKGKTTKNAVKLCVAAWLPAKAQVFPEHLLVGEKNCQEREKKRYAAGRAVAFAVPLLELVHEWEGSGFRLEAGKKRVYRLKLAAAHNGYFPALKGKSKP